MLINDTLLTVNVAKLFTDGHPRTARNLETGSGAIVDQGGGVEKEERGPRT